MATTTTTPTASTIEQLTEREIDTLCAVAEAAAGRRGATVTDIAACCPTVPDVDGVLTALHRDGIVTVTAGAAALTSHGRDVCLYL